MNKHRELVILEKLQKDQVCTINQLSLLCDASYKTIQSDIKHLNDRFYRHHFHSRIERQRGVGVAIVDEDHHELEVIMTELLAQSNDMQVQDKETMALKIALMLFQHSYLKIDDLCDTLCLSRSVVNEVVTLTRSMLKKWEIQVASKPHYGLYLEGLERDMRRFLFENLVLKQEEEIHELLQIDASTFFSLRERMIAIIRNFDVSINDVILEQLLLYVEVMVIRMQGQHFMEEETLHLEKTSFEYILSEKIAKQIEKDIETTLLPSEIDWICRFVIGKYLKKAESDIVIENGIIEELLPKAIQAIKEQYGYDFTHDIEFYTSMSIHLNALLKRAKVGNFLINPMLDNIKTYSLLAYDMATDVSLLINEVIDDCLPDDEISFFAIYLHLAIERQKQKIIPRKALVVCPSGKGMSEMVAHFVRKQFGEYISELKTCGYYDLDHIDFSLYDYIFTMHAEKLKVPLPVIEFSLNANKYSIEQAKLQMLGKRHEISPMERLSPPSLFFPELKAHDKEEVLRTIIANIGQVLALHDDFLASVLRREQIVSTELDTGFAIPHPLDRNMAESSFFSVSVLNNPILWGKKKIRVVLLTYIKGDMEDLDLFYDIFAQLVTNKEYQVALVDKPTYETFLEIVDEISDQVKEY